MNRKVPVARIIVSVICLVGVVYFAVEASRYKRHVYQAKKDEPIRLKVNLSEPGTYEGTFLHTHNSPHGQIFYIETNDVEVSYQNATDMLKGLQGRILITDDSNSVVFTKDFAASDFSFRDWQNPNTPSLHLLNSTRIAKGDYNLQLLIEQGAPALADKNHFFVCRYLLCGLELMPVMILRIISIICFVVGVVLLLVPVVKTKLICRQKRKKNSNSTMGKNSE